MKKYRFIETITIMILCLCLALPVQAATTPKSSLDADTSADEYTATINCGDGETRNYHIFAQGSKSFGATKKNYICQHGCAVCSLTTVLSAFTEKYKDYTPDKTYKILEKKVFGSSVWNANYRRSLSSQRPISLYGITKVLASCNIRTKYVRNFKNASAVKAITNHLKKGNPVIIELNNHTQINGKFSKKYDSKWSSSKHTVVLLGMTDNNQVIVADSAKRKWSGKQQRIKYVKMSTLVKYMIPCKNIGYDCYYTNVKQDGGYILVNP